VILNNQSLQLVQSSQISGKHVLVYTAPTVRSGGRLPSHFSCLYREQNKINFAEQNVRLTQKQYADTERHLFQSVAQKWLDVWAARKQLDLLGTAKANIDSLANINRLAPEKPGHNIYRPRPYRAAGKSVRHSAQIRIQGIPQSAFNLKFLMGVQDSIRIDTTDQFAFAFPDQMDAIVQQALQNRTDIQAIKSTMDVADANIKLQRSNALPVRRNWA
jgi:cobalt-zinc-cadmium efflux system outer membrane protein